MLGEKLSKEQRRPRRSAVSWLQLLWTLQTLKQKEQRQEEGSQTLVEILTSPGRRLASGLPLPTSLEGQTTSRWQLTRQRYQSYDRPPLRPARTPLPPRPPPSSLSRPPGSATSSSAGTSSSMASAASRTRVACMVTTWYVAPCLILREDRRGRRDPTRRPLTSSSRADTPARSLAE